MKRLAIPLLFFALIVGSVAIADPAGEAIAVHTVPPKYGPGLPEGKGWFKLILDDSGRVLRVSVLKSKGHRELDNSAVTALKQWRFNPVPEKYVTMPVDFRQKAQSPGMHVDYQ